jgi:hypothetical protein
MGNLVRGIKITIGSHSLNRWTKDDIIDNQFADNFKRRKFVHAHVVGEISDVHIVD